MQTQWLPHVATVLYDPVHANRHLTRNALFTLGFREIEAVTTLSDLRRVFELGSCDLCIVDVTNEESEACKLIRELRLGRLGANSFAVIIATTWRHSGDLVRTVIESGADDLLIRPLSTGTLKARIEQQVESRKHFVVTSTYIGPDRRRSAGRDESPGLIEVPNSLKLKVRDGILSGASTSEIQEIRRQIERQRVEKNAFHIALACQLIAEHLEAPDASYDLNRELTSLGETAADLKQRVAATEFATVAPFCEGLEAAVKELTQALKTGSKGDRAGKPLALLTQLSKGIQLALDAGKDESALSREIAETVERIKTRRAAIVEDRQAAATGSSAAAGA
jgi:DNA-binding response OmpR family regulator